MPNTYRVVQWNTGNVGKSSLKSIADNPTLELVGCYAWSRDKVGRDAGELVDVGAGSTGDVSLAVPALVVIAHHRAGQG